MGELIVYQRLPFTLSNISQTTEQIELKFLKEIIRPWELYVFLSKTLVGLVYDCDISRFLYELNIFCAPTTAESRAKIWYQ